MAEEGTCFSLDPDLDLTAGEFFPGNANCGVFMDSCPDRWGQVLMQRLEAVESREQKRMPVTLGVWDFLLGVQDCTRMGALRFSRIGKVVGGWKSRARKLGLSAYEISGAEHLFKSTLL